MGTRSRSEFEEDRTTLQRLEQTCRESVVPLFSDLRDDGSFDFHGTGVLFGHAGERFLLTASHVTEKLLQAGRWNLRLEGLVAPLALCSVPADRDDADSDEVLFAYVQEQDDEGNVDLSLIKLGDSTGRTIANARHRFVTESDVVAPPVDDGDRFAVIGFPDELASAPGGRVRTDYLAILASQYVGSTEGSQFVVDRDIHLLLQHRSVAIGEDGTYTDVPELPGMSGCAVWQFPEVASRTIYVPQQRPRLVAVQTSRWRDRWVKATFVAPFLSGLLSKLSVPRQSGEKYSC